MSLVQDFCRVFLRYIDVHLDTKLVNQDAFVISLLCIPPTRLDVLVCVHRAEARFTAVGTKLPSGVKARHISSVGRSLAATPPPVPPVPICAGSEALYEDTVPEEADEDISPKLPEHRGVEQEVAKKKVAIAKAAVTKKADEVAKQTAEAVKKKKAEDEAEAAATEQRDEDAATAKKKADGNTPSSAVLPRGSWQPMYGRSPPSTRSTHSCAAMLRPDHQEASARKGSCDEPTDGVKDDKGTQEFASTPTKSLEGGGPSSPELHCPPEGEASPDPKSENPDYHPASWISASYTDQG